MIARPPWYARRAGESRGPRDVTVRSMTRDMIARSMTPETAHAAVAQERPALLDDGARARVMGDLARAINAVLGPGHPFVVSRDSGAARGSLLVLRRRGEQAVVRTADTEGMLTWLNLVVPTTYAGCMIPVLRAMPDHPDLTTLAAVAAYLANRAVEMGDR